MTALKGTNFQDRIAAAAEARKALAEKFKDRPAPDDPEVIARREARQEVLRARTEREAIRAKERAARAAEEARRKEEERLAREEKERREAEEREQLRTLEAEEKARLEAEKKAERDARYAARKANKQKRKEEARRFY